MMISKKDLDLLTDQFDEDGDGQITYEEFIAKVMPPEITHGGGGILDFPCDDPASKGTLKIEKLKFSKLCTILVVIIVKIIFMCSFFFYCLLCNHTFQTNLNSGINLSELFNYIAFFF